MVVRVLDHVAQCYTAADGRVIGDILRKLLSQGAVVHVSFAGVNNAPSSFLNAALVGLLDTFSYTFIRDHLKISGGTPQINDAIRRQFRDESKVAA